MTSETPFDRYRFWPRTQFRQFSRAVAYVTTFDDGGNDGIGTSFHIGDGVFVTARHVVENREIKEIGFDDSWALYEMSKDPKNWGKKHTHGAISIKKGPFYHPNSDTDVACFVAAPYPREYIPLGGHLDDYLSQYELVLYRTLVLGYPPIPFSDRPSLVASLGEVNALIGKYTGGHPHFVISTIARGGFSGGPALVAYDENNPNGGTAALGLVTESLTSNYQPVELGYMAVLTVDPIYACLEHHDLLPAHQNIDDLRNPQDC